MMFPSAVRREGERDDAFRVTICAWCGRRAAGECWEDEQDVLPHGLEPARSSSICPRCFEKLAPGVPYPQQR